MKSKYNKERMDIIVKLNGILCVSEGNSFELKYLEEKEGDILSMIDDIKKVFNYSLWSYFKGKREVISLVKSVYKEMGYMLDRKDIQVNKVRKYVYILRKCENPKGIFI